MSFAQLFAASSLSLIVLGISSVYDLLSRRVPNYLTGIAAIIALLYPWLTNNSIGITSSYLGGFLGLMFFLLPYIGGFMGAGDVKLFGVTGLFVGVEQILSLSLYVSIAGGILALIYLIEHKIRNIVIKDIKDIQTVSKIKLPYAIAIFSGAFYMFISERMT